jgi:O-antigen/teichoic acid export membrane protein
VSAEAPNPSATADAHASAADRKIAVRNAVKMAASLVGTMGVAFGVRMLLPRYLGPDAFGPLKFADNLAIAGFVFLGFGVDTYVRTHVSVDRSIASDFFAGIFAVRLLATPVVCAALYAWLRHTHQSGEVIGYVFAYGAAQVFIITNQSLSALLQAVGTVDGLSINNIVSKLLWGGGVLLTVMTGLPLVGIPLAFLASELVRAVINWWLVRKHLELKVRWNTAATKAMFLASLPIYLNAVGHHVYNKIDTSMLESLGPRAVGWYGAASEFAGLTFMIAPMIGWIMLPLFARANSRSEAEYTDVLRRTLEMVLIIAFPISLAIGVGADLWIHLFFGAEFAPATLALQILAPVFLITYVAMIGGNAMMLQNRAWHMAGISMAGLAINVGLNLWLIPVFAAWKGDEGGGAAAALVQVITELLVTAAMMVTIGTRAFDRRSLTMIAKTLGVCAAVVALDRFLFSMGVARPLGVAASAVAYVVLVLAVRAVPLKETVEFMRSAFKRRKTRTA